MTIREQSRIAVLNGVMEGKVLVAEAARLMGVSERHAWRLLRAYRKEGVAAVAHGNRGRRPSTTTCPEIQEKVMALANGDAGWSATSLPLIACPRIKRGGDDGCEKWGDQPAQAIRRSEHSPCLQGERVEAQCLLRHARIVPLRITKKPWTTRKNQ